MERYFYKSSQVKIFGDFYVRNIVFSVLPTRRIPKKDATKVSAKRSLSFKDNTDARVLMDTIKESQPEASPTKMAEQVESVAPLASAGTVRLGFWV